MSRADTENRILDFIRDEVEARGYAPTYGEIGKAVGLRSNASIAKCLDRLEEAGLIERTPHRARGIRLRDRTEQGAADRT